MANTREMEERRYAAMQGLTALVECLKTTNPQSIFVIGKESALDSTKLQNITNRWADQAVDVLAKAMQIADAIGADVLDMFEGKPSDAHIPPAPSA